MKRGNDLTKKAIVGGLTVLGTTFICLSAIAKRKKNDSVYENEPNQKNPLEGKKVEFVEDPHDPENADGVRGHLVEVGDSEEIKTTYHIVKRGIDIILSFGGLVILSPVYAAIVIAIKIDDPGPVFFTQKRVGKNKQYFKLHKFRSMKMSTPHNVPTHMLENPEQYITRVGAFLRKYSLDELPQIWDIWINNMSIIGPRPALWNQDKLISLREMYGANEIKPGLTGWAQIMGRDELELDSKAKFDGEYVKKENIWFDVRCFFGTIAKVFKKEGIVEGNTKEKGDDKTVVWIINQYNTLPENGRLNRHYYFSRNLVKDDYDPILFLGSSPHGTDVQLISDNRKYFVDERHGFKTVLINARNYYGSTKRRALSMLDFYKNLMSSHHDFKKPDIVYGSSAHPLNCVLAIQIAKKYGVPCINEVRDLWPESLTEFEIVKKGSIIEKMIARLFSWIYQKSDVVIFTFKNGKKYIKDIGLDDRVKINKIQYINNGVDLEEFQFNLSEFNLHDPELLDENTFKVIYTGAMGKPNQIEKIVEAAEKLNNEKYSDIHFVLYGDGSERKLLEEKCKKNGINNVSFKGVVEKKYIPFILHKADVNVFTIKQSDLYKYGISLNKVFDYFAAGKPIVTNNDVIESVTNGKQCCIISDNLADGIIEVYNSSKECKKSWSHAAKELADDYSYTSLTKKLEEIIDELISGGFHCEDMSHNKCTCHK